MVNLSNAELRKKIIKCFEVVSFLLERATIVTKNIDDKNILQTPSDCDINYLKLFILKKFVFTAT